MPTDNFDFDRMSRMARETPEQLDQWLNEQVELLISSAPESHQHRLRGLQFQIDMERQKAANPMASCIRLSQMMHESFSRLRDTLNSATEGKPLPEQTEKTAATVIPFAKAQ